MQRDRSSPTNAVETVELSRRFGSTLALNAINLRVPRGCVFGLLGVNGAGKTTLLKLLLGHLKPSSGQITLLDRSLEGHLLEIRNRVGYVAEDRYLYDWMTVEEILRFTRAFYPRWDQAKVGRLLERFQLPPGRVIRQLSRGQRARLCLLLALAHNPELIILDEPTSGLDPLAQRDFRENVIQEIAAEGRTILLSSHQVEEIERLADFVAILQQGRLLACAPVDGLKESFRQVRLARNTDGASLSGLPGVLSLPQRGRDPILVVKDFHPGLLRELAHRGGTEPEVLPMSLEEIFFALVSESAPPGEAI